MIDSILRCDKPVINRVNGLRIAGCQEIGMACDFSIAVDTAVFGQAGPRHGSAPDGGSTDFLPLYVGFSPAMESGVLCTQWSAHKALRLGLLNQVVPVLKVGGEWIPNPMVIIDRFADAFGNIVFGDFKQGVERQAAQDILARSSTDLGALDTAVGALCTKILMLMPECVTKTISSLRKHKQWHWDNTSVTNREWLALNMMTEGRAGFRAFNEGSKDRREVDFIKLRQRLAAGHPWNDDLLRSILPPSKQLQAQR
jgi:6-oxo-cyclohex-1-ene-carbonyl-CoA hydrolase